MSKTIEDFKEYAENQVNNIIDALDSIKVNRVTVLTGDNASGKSLIRKLVWSTVKKQVGHQVKCADTSMERRTGLHSEMGGMGCFVRDTEWLATSSNTISFIKTVTNAHDRYVIIDEPEIGLSESLQYSIADYLSKKISTILEKNYGILIITHSKIFIKNLTVDFDFINLQKKSLEEYLNEEPELIDLEEFDNKSTALYRELEEHLKPAN